MCEPTTLNKIEEIVNDKMKAGEMFTAFNITLALQQTGIHKYHREIRNDIKRSANDLMPTHNYQRTYIKLEGFDASAFLYHPVGADITIYEPSQPPAQLAATAINQTLEDVEDGDDDEVDQDDDEDQEESDLSDESDEVDDLVRDPA